MNKNESIPLIIVNLPQRGWRMLKKQTHSIIRVRFFCYLREQIASAMEKKEYYIADNNMQKGPFSLEELGEQGLERTTRVYRRGFESFMNAEDVKEIKDYYFSGKRPAAKPIPKPVSDESTVVAAGPADMDAVREAARRERMLREQAERRKREAANVQSATPAAVPPPPVGATVVEEVVEAKEWYLRNDGVQSGPLTLTELKGCTLLPQTIVWRAGMADWTEATLVPEIAPFVAPAPFTPAPVPAPMPAQTVTTPPPLSTPMESPAVADTSARDASIYGNPSGMPIFGLLLSLLFIFFIIVMYFGTDFSYKMSFMGGFYEYPAVMCGGGILMSLIFGISGLVNASSAKRLYFKDQIPKACKKSGTATAYGWAAVLFATFGIISGLLTLSFLGEI